MRRLVLPVVIFALAWVIGLGAIADHRRKQHRINEAQVSEWYCAHRGTRCGGPSSVVIERRWNERQLGYEIAVSVLGGAAIALGAYRAARR